MATNAKTEIKKQLQVISANVANIKHNASVIESFAKSLRQRDKISEKVETILLDAAKQITDSAGFIG